MGSGLWRIEGALLQEAVAAVLKVAAPGHSRDPGAPDEVVRREGLEPTTR